MPSFLFLLHKRIWKLISAIRILTVFAITNGNLWMAQALHRLGKGLEKTTRLKVVFLVMITEEKLIPYHTCDLPAGPFFVVAPHPDDETFGMGGTIVLAKRKGIPVHVLILTDGQLAGNFSIRREESQRAGHVLGVSHLYFWGLQDRQLIQTSLSQGAMSRILEEIAPRTVFLPALQEFHPDHRATTYMFWEALKELKFDGELWIYEITRQSEVNRLIDITSAVPRKIEAIQCYSSQINQNNYEAVVLGLNAARSYTLGPEVTHAEGFWQVEDWKAKKPFTEHIHAVQRYRYGFMQSACPLVSIVVRTKDRPDLLQEALKSIAAQTYSPIEAVVVNDGGENVTPLVDSFVGPIGNIKLIRNPESRGRAAAANQGLQAAEGNWIGFLDDDDVLESSALENLITDAIEKDVNVVYGQVLREHYLSDGTRDPEKEDYLYTRAFDRNLLLVQNYIPFNALLFKREALVQCGPLAEDLSLYEDWDLLLRLAANHDFLYVPVLVARYRCFGTSTAEGTRFFAEESILAANVVRERWCSRLSPELVDAFLRYIDKETADLEEIRNERQVLRKTVESVTRDRDFWQAQVRLMEASISWRSTKPLRWLRAFQLKRAKVPLVADTSLPPLESKSQEDLFSGFKRLFEPDTENVMRDISPNDQMFHDDEESHYLSVGQSALRCIKLAMLAAGKDSADIQTILDLPCGHGRVLRTLRAAFPDAQITACDLLQDGVDFCAKTFNAIPVYSTDDPDRIPIEGSFDLIWCGSLLTHLSSDRWTGFLNFFNSYLNSGGILVFSVHGPSCVYAIREGRVSYGLEEGQLTQLLEDYSQRGFGYVDYPNTMGYGISVSSPSWVLSKLEELFNLRLLAYTEMGWDEHQDVIACVKDPLAARLKRALGN
jgi:LmbE family N-acetylglucosaminyl deacetylase/glycosyltransferase involved in cell wall biosynthesis